MAASMDALQSFTYLSEYIPQWLTQLDDLLAKCEVQYERFTRITQHGEVKLTRKKRQASTESLRPGKDEDIPSVLPPNKHVDTPALDASGVRLSAMEASHVSNVIPPQGIPRKRRAGSELSASPSNHCRYRTKNMVIVYYDSEIQEAFESIVKSIASARNNLRKGKNAANFKLRMASMGLGDFGLDKSSDKMEGLALDSKMIMTPTMARIRLGRQAVGNEMKCFEDADHNLEEAQSLCERGAHQILRDGDCHPEIESTRKRFGSCDGIARREIDRLKKEQDSSRHQHVEQHEAEEAEERTLVGDSTPPTDRMDEKPIDLAPTSKINPPPLTEVRFAGTGAIEIDDDSDSESVQIDMAAIRRTVRSTRV